MNPSTQRSYVWLFWSLALLGLVLDLGSKYGVFYALYRPQLQGEAPIIPGAFKLLVQYTPQKETGDGLFAQLRTISSDQLPRLNHGALFGLGGKNSYGNTIFSIVSLLAAAVIIYWSTRQQTRRDPFLCISLGLILAGTLGNFYDRVVFGGVRDFLYWYYLIDWPVFNIADCCLVIGAGLLLLQAMFTETTVVEQQACTAQNETHHSEQHEVA